MQADLLRTNLHNCRERAKQPRKSSSGFLVGLLLLEVWGDGLHDLVSLGDIVDHQSVEVLGSSELELGDVSLLGFLDSDLFGLGKVLLLSSHDLDEYLEVFNFSGHIFLVPLII